MDPRVLQALAEWEGSVPSDETADPIWTLNCYRVARYLVDMVATDAAALRVHADAKTIGQLTRAVASIGANLSEGYSRRTSSDRARFYGYALGSAREASLWYRSIAPFLAPHVLELRMLLLSQERRLLVGMLKAVQKASGSRFESG